MANQPKKYTKFVATAATATLVASAIVPVASAAELSDIKGNTHEEHINALVDAGVINGYPDGTFKPNKTLTRSDVVKLLGKYLETQGYEPAGNYKNSPAFADLSTKTNEELLKYASVVKESGVFVGSNGNLKAGDPITRENMAIVLVRMANTLHDISLEEFVGEQEFSGDVKDLAQAKAEARSAISVLDYYDITNPTVANFNPKGDTTRGQFATFLNKTINAEFSGAEQGTSKVVPTAIELAEKSNQSAFGEKVTVTAKVTVAEGESAEGIPVTFTVDSGNDTLLIPQIKEEIKTNAEGVATFTYTREHRYSTSRALTDDVTAYPTIKPTLKANAVVYWGQAFTIKDVTEGSTIANGASKVYEVTGTPNTFAYVAFEENLNVTPDKVAKVDVKGLTTYKLREDGSFTSADVATVNYPFELTTGGKQVSVIKFDATGKANLVLSGANSTVTPIVYSPVNSYRDSLYNEGRSVAYSKTALQVKGSTVTFTQNQVFKLAVTAAGNANAAYSKATLSTGDTVNVNHEIGGRDYTALLTDKDGKPVANATLNVYFDANANDENAKINVIDSNDKVLAKVSSGTGFYVTVKTNSKGEATFTVTNSKENGYAKPVVFLDNGATLGTLDTTDLQTAGELTYFTTVSASQYTSELVVSNLADDEKSVIGLNEVAKFTYQLSDQNGKPRSYANASTVVSYTVTNTGASTLSVDNGAYTVLPGGSVTFTRTLASNSTNTSIIVSSNGATGSATVTASPSTTGLTVGTVTKSVSFVASTTTPTFAVAKSTKTDGTVASADTVTLTFTDAIALSNITVLAENGASIATSLDSTNKVVTATFAPINTLYSNNTANDEFLVTYAGKVYKFKLLADGSFSLQ